VLRGAPQVAGVQNTVALGRLIYTDYILLFQMSGLVLLVAMIGAIVLTHRRPQNTRRQVIAVQVGRTVSETLEMMTVELGAGTNATGIIRPKVAEPETVDDHAGGGHGAGGH
jgi:NADH-quinone oxidoreductase subunit J